MPGNESMAVTIAIVGCLDTKGEELRFIKEVLEGDGVRTHVIDTGVLTGVLTGQAVRADTPRENVAAAAGSSIEELRAAGDRGNAVKVMSTGAAKVAADLCRAGAIQGIIAAGGSANTTIGCAAMRALPIGFPKVMVSTLASGDVSPYVQTKDILMLYSVVDIAGVNRISARILSNAARAVAAMAAGRPVPVESSRPIVAATMFGVTTPCVSTARKALEAAGYEVLVFHATGTGGRAMEDLIEDGYIAGVLDITTTELADELVGGILSAGPRRLTVAGSVGIPKVVSVGAIDMVNFGPRDTVPPKFQGRKFYQHNPNVTLMRTTPEENAELGKRIAERLRGAKAPVRVILPSRGVSSYAKEGGPFHDPEADRCLIESIARWADRSVPVEIMDTDINDPRFAGRCAAALLDLMAEREQSRERA